LAPIHCSEAVFYRIANYNFNLFVEFRQVRGGIIKNYSEIGKGLDMNAGLDGLDMNVGLYGLKLE